MYKKLLAYTIIAMAGASCAMPAGRMADVDPRGWEAADTATVVYQNADTLSARRMSLLFKCGEAFDADTLRLSVTVQSPDSVVFSEIFEARLNPQTMRSGGYEAKVPCRESVVLSRTGKYVFSIAPAADKPVRGISAAGISLE